MLEPISVSDLEALLAAARAATPGPWRDMPTGQRYAVTHKNPGPDVCRASRPNNAAYIAAFSPDVALALIEELIALRERCAYLEKCRARE